MSAFSEAYNKLFPPATAREVYGIHAKEPLPINTGMLEQLAHGEQLISFRLIGGGFCNSKTMAREILRLRAKLTAFDGGAERG